MAGIIGAIVASYRDALTAFDSLRRNHGCRQQHHHRDVRVLKLTE